MQQFDNVNSAYVWLADEIQYASAKQPTRYGESKELHPYAFQINDFTDYFLHDTARIPNFPMAIMEFVYFLTGQQDDWITKYNKQLKEYLDHSYHGTPYFNAQYGNRARCAFSNTDQIQDVIDSLKRDPDSRQAAIVYRHPWMDHGEKSTKDRACNIASLFVIREKRLDITQLVRSQDFIWGLPYNFMQFGFLTQYIAEQLELPVGSYSEMVQSLHVYEKHYPQLRRIQTHGLETKPKKLTVPELGEFDMRDIVACIKGLEAVFEEDGYMSDNLEFKISHSPFWSNALVVLNAYLAKKHDGENEYVIGILEHCTNDLFKVMATRYFCEYYKSFADAQVKYDESLFKLAWGLD